MIATSDGLIMAVHPDAMAETSGRKRQFIGKFHGPIIKHTPRGSGAIFRVANLEAISLGTHSGYDQYFKLSIA